MTSDIIAALALLVTIARWWVSYLEAKKHKVYLIGLARKMLELTEEYDQFIDEYDLQIKILTRDVDMLHSEGQVKSMVSKAQPIVNGNEVELTDGLPMQGSILIVGQSGSGKSNLVMTQIMRRVRGGQEVHCIDTKGEMVPIFGQYVDCVVPERAGDKFQELLAIAKERQALFAATTKKLSLPCRDYGEYFKVTGEKLPTVALIVEELIVLMDIVDEAKLIEMLVIGRSAGIFVVALAQYIKADILSRKGLVNFQTRVFLGAFDNIACGLIFNLDKSSRTMVEDFVGPPGKAAIQEGGTMTTRTMPQVMDHHLVPFIRGEV